MVYAMGSSTSGDGNKVVEFPPPEIAPEERARRLRVAVDRLAGLPTCEWLLYLEDDAKKYGVSRADLKAMVEATIRANEKKAREDKAEDRQRARHDESKQERAERERKREEREQKREQERADMEAERRQRQKDKALAAIIKLPKSEREAKLRELAKKLDEDVELLRDELILLVGDEEEKIESGEVEPWPEPVDTRALLSELETQFRRYIIVHREPVAVAITLWICFAWCHEIATYSPILVIQAGDTATAKTTASKVIALLTPRAYVVAEPRGATLYRLVDRYHPTLIVDDADRLLPRRPDLAHIVNVSWTRGTTIPRVDIRGNIHRYDPFCPKLLNGIGLTAYLDRATQTRCITAELLPKLAGEKVANFRHAIRDERFLTLRRQLMRWAADNMSVLANADPAMPEALDDRQQMNWELMFAIADLAGSDWPAKTRGAATKLARERDEPSQGKRLLAAFRSLFRKQGALLTSRQVEQLLTADGDSEWANYKGHPINKWEIASLLKPYGIAPVVIHPRGRAADRGYNVRQFETVFRHYLPPESPRAVVRKPRGKPRK
jgi:putative DNA primase/helicase